MNSNHTTQSQEVHCRLTHVRHPEGELRTAGARSYCLDCSSDAATVARTRDVRKGHVTGSVTWYKEQAEPYLQSVIEPSCT
jgi:hypothetical protein